MKRIFFGIIALLIVFLVLSSCTTMRQFYGLTLVNNSRAKDVSSEELQNFLKQDKTDEHSIISYTHKVGLPTGELSANTRYIALFNKNGDGAGIESLHEFVTSGYGCVNFAVDLHNNAEQAGIRCAVVTNLEVGHAFNAFQTKDRGLVFTDAWAGSDSLSYWDSSLKTMVVPYCRVREGVGDTWSEYLGNPENFKVEW